MQYFGCVPKKVQKLHIQKIGKNSSYAKMVDKLRVAALRNLELFPGFWSNM